MASRRAVLKLAAATGALAGVRDAAASQPATIELDAQASGWVGRSPPAIAGQTNPTLSLVSGQSYRVRWTNADGLPHNFAVSTAAEERLVASEIVDQQGATQTVDFEATPAMATYRCEVHPQTMRGSVAVDETGAAGNETAPDNETGNETAEPEPRPPDEPAAEEPTPEAQGPPPVLEPGPIVLGGLAQFWLGLAPAGIRERPNPTLRLRPGAEYELVWMNLDGVEHDFHLVSAAGEDLEDTSSRDDVGDTHSTSFEATPEMAEYLCAFHPQSMRGAVEVG